MYQAEYVTSPRSQRPSHADFDQNAIVMQERSCHNLSQPERKRRTLASCMQPRNQADQSGREMNEIETNETEGQRYTEIVI
jgi:hypothetical protein